MISCDMYRVLKVLPRAPEFVRLSEIEQIEGIDVGQLAHLLEESFERGYSKIRRRDPTGNITNFRFYLSEEGQEAIEEYERVAEAEERDKKAAIESMRSRWIAFLGLIVAAMSFLHQCCK